MPRLNEMPDIIIICTNERADKLCTILKNHCPDIIIKHFSEDRIGDDWYVIPKTDKGSTVGSAVFSESEVNDAKKT